jgi:site-specific DNA-methyltransferase (adenine-specific)
MIEVADNSIHLIATSPPYWNIKDYDTNEQIGYYQSFEDYINHLNLVWQECYRTLMNGCRLCINIADTLASKANYGRHKVMAIHTEIIKFCEIIGFDYMGAIIWQKIGNDKGVFLGSYPFPRNGVVQVDYEYILVFRKSGKSPNPTQEQKELSRMTLTEWQKYFSGHWKFPGTLQNKGHIAMYPQELPRRLISMYSFVRETVLDPFGGSGTTALAAKNIGRNSVSYEINPTYIEVIKDKLQTYQGDLFGTSFEFVAQQAIEADFANQISQLPYQFKDTNTPITVDQ